MAGGWTSSAIRAVAIGASVVAAAAPVQAQEAVERPYDLPAQPLGDALRAVGVMSGTNIIADSSLLIGKIAPPLSGRFSAVDAVRILLRGSGLHLRRAGNSLIIERDNAQTSSSGTAESGAASADIIVTGSQIHGNAPAGASVLTIDRRDIDRSGYATTQQIIQSLPQNYNGGTNEATVGFSNRGNASANIGYGSSINLRGLGSSSTLVLIDGNRPALGGTFGAFADLSLIPSSTIERIEILADGSSALYGSDAVAGVANVILRDQFNGAETRIRYGSADGDFGEVQASQLVGKSWRTGHLTLAYEYYRRGRLSADQRPYATEDLVPFGGADYRKSFSNPGTIIAANGEQFGIPKNQDGTDLTAAELLAGQPNLSDSRAGTDLLPRQESHSALASFTKDLDDTLRFTAQALFARRQFNTRFLPDNFGYVSVPTTNPFYVDPIGTSEPVTINYDFRPDLGPETLHGIVQAISGSIGFEKTLGPWTATLRSSYGAQVENSRYDNIINYYRLTLALDDPDPATAYNLFGDGSHTNPTTIDSIRGYYRSHGLFRVWSTSAKVDGPLVTLPAGDLKVALGGEYRTEYNDFTTLDYEFTADPQTAATSGLPAERKILAGYAELFVPLFGGGATHPGLHRLDLSIAGRIEHYNDFGTTANPKVGITWQPLDGIEFRGTFGTSFRAPGLHDLAQGPGTGLYEPVALPDPQSPTGSTNALVLVGNQPGIGPEHATTWTAGVTLRPRGVTGLNVEANYFDINYRDRIAMISADYFNFLLNRATYAPVIDDAPTAADIAGYYANPNFSNPYGIAASDIAVVIDARTQNLSSVHQNGIDVDIAYHHALGRGDARLGLSGSYIFRIEQKITASAPSYDTLGTLGSPVDLRLRGNGGYSIGRLDVSAFVNFVDGYVNQTVVPHQPVSSWTTVDLQAAYSLPASGLLGGVKVALSVSNLFDREPPYVENYTGISAVGFDSDQASAIGRFVSLQLVKSW